MFAWSRSVRPAFNHTLRAQRDSLWLTLQMLTSGVFPASLTDFQLPLDAALAALPVVRLGGVVFRHHLHELARQRGVLEGKQTEVMRSRVSADDRCNQPIRWLRCTCVLRILRSADDRFCPSSCSMVCWIPTKN